MTTRISDLIPMLNDRLNCSQSIPFRAVMMALLFSTLVTVRVEAKEEDSPALAPRLENLGNLHYPITTTNPEVQFFFDQGLRLTYAFNHAEAIRSFKEASRNDASAAMPYWGLALALGPNINDPMPREREVEALAAINKALERRDSVNEKERAMIDALATRYSAQPVDDRSSFDLAYKLAMADLAQQYPGDPEIRTLHAAAIMNTMPWNYWTKTGKANGGTMDAIEAVEAVVADFPDHPGALHYHIHLVEASKDPDRAESSADRLGKLMPGAGHLVHMPSHIYIRVGRYDDAAKANQDAILADEDYISQCQAQGLYPIGYYPHNIHFLWAAAEMDGREQLATESAIKVASKVPLEQIDEISFFQRNLVIPYFAWIRFGNWQAILDAPEPIDRPYPRAIWRYARALALNATGDLAGAQNEAKKLRRLAKTKALHEQIVTSAPADHLVRLALDITKGELAATRGREKKAVRLLERAVARQDDLPYSEPPIWHYPTRQTLGAVLLQFERPEQAEQVYRRDLEENRHNGWSLYGLTQALEAQGKIEEAQKTRARFKKAWQRADVEIHGSRFGPKS